MRILLLFCILYFAKDHIPDGSYSCKNWKIVSKEIYRISKALGDKHPELAVAQAALETGHGKRLAGENNYWGIKAKSKRGNSTRTTEYKDGQFMKTTATFANYKTLADGCRARILLLREPRYRSYWSTTNKNTAANSLQKSGYATDPNYSKKLKGLME